jgi:hypothetical protein
MYYYSLLRFHISANNYMRTRRKLEKHSLDLLKNRRKLRIITNRDLYSRLRTFKTPFIK